MYMMGTNCYGSYQGAGTYYGTNGLGTPQAGPSGSYYMMGWTGGGYYATGLGSYGMTGSGTYYGLSGYSSPVNPV